MVAAAEGRLKPDWKRKRGEEIHNNSIEQVDALLGGKPVVAFRSEKSFTFPMVEGLFEEKTTFLPSIDGPVTVTVRRMPGEVRRVQLRGEHASVSYKAGDEESPLFWVTEPDPKGGYRGSVIQLGPGSLDHSDARFERAVAAVIGYVRDNREGSTPCEPLPEPHGNPGP